MKTCLKLYHHSTFEEGDGDGKDGGKGRGRRLNVELTYVLCFLTLFLAFGGGVPGFCLFPLRMWFPGLLRFEKRDL